MRPRPGGTHSPPLPTRHPWVGGKGEGGCSSSSTGGLQARPSLATCTNEANEQARGNPSVPPPFYWEQKHPGGAGEGVEIPQPEVPKPPLPATGSTGGTSPGSANFGTTTVTPSPAGLETKQRAKWGGGTTQGHPPPKKKKVCHPALSPQDPPWGAGSSPVRCRGGGVAYCLPWPPRGCCPRGGALHIQTLLHIEYK